MINAVQIDTNSVCGSLCFCCPAKYYKRPHISLMSNDMFESILSQLNEGINQGLVSEHYSIWLSSYNDVLHDQFLKDRLDLLRKHKRQFQLLTNGIRLLDQADLLSEYQDVIHGYSINIPAGNSVDYHKYSGNNTLIFERIINGLIYLYSKNPSRYKQIVTVTVNGVYDDPIARAQMKLDIPVGDTDKQVAQLIKIQPFRVTDARPLCDRAGLLRKVNVIDNQAEGVRELWKLPVGATKATGCNGGSRLTDWVHVSSKGDLYTCCQDFFEKHSYGNLNETNLLDAIQSERRSEVIEETLEELCIQCWFAY